MNKISLQDFCKTFFIFLSLFVTSCFRNSDSSSSFRIVGLNGESRQVQTRLPELNARILESQGHQVRQQDIAPAQTQSQPQQQATLQNQYTTSKNADFGTDNAPKDTLQADQGKPVYNLVNKDVANSSDKISNQKSEALTSAGVAADKDQEIQYDLSDSEKSDEQDKKSGKKMKLKSGKSAPIKEAAAEASSSTEKKKGIFVQTGSFSTEENAKQDLTRVQKFHKGEIIEANFGEKKVYRVLLGPISNDKKAKNLVRKIKGSGHDAIVVKNK